VSANAKFNIVIPARFQSERFPGKPLAEISGKAMVLHVYERAQQSGAAEVLIATDNKKIFDAASAAGAQVCMTSDQHETGTDRLAEVVALQKWENDSIVVNVQGDEPLIPVACINQVANNLHSHSTAVMSTLATPIVTVDDYQNPNVVKVLSNVNGMAMLFSRASVPYARDGVTSDESVVSLKAMRHIGIYAYRSGFLRRYPALPECALEKIEKLEQLRVLYRGESIHVDTACEIPGPGVDTPEQLAQVQKIISTSD